MQKMAMKQGLRIVLAVYVLCQMMKYGQSTSCMKEHPQSSICRASFVIKAKVLDTDWTADNQENTINRYLRPRIVQVELRKIYNGNKIVNATKFSHVNIMYTSLDTIDLKVGEKYILTGWNFGSILMMNMCNWHSPSDALSTAQSLVVEHSHSRLFCLCRIKACYGSGCKKDARSCTLKKQKADCHSKSQVCMSFNGCRWMSPGKPVTC